MAIVLQTIAMTDVWTPYERPPQPFTLWSAIPRALQSFVVAATEMDAKPLNDDYIINLTATLPPNFGYVMNSAAMMIDVDRAADFRPDVLFNLQNFYRAPIDVSVALSMTWRQPAPISGLPTTNRSTEVSQPWPSYPMEAPRGVSGILVSMTMTNDNNTAMAAGVVNAYVSFWQFDLEQLRKYPINSPSPVHSR